MDNSSKKKNEERKQQIHAFSNNFGAISIDEINIDDNEKNILKYKNNNTNLFSKKKKNRT
jgi:hypothetical protein